jgi:hypothetical protein
VSHSKQIGKTPSTRTASALSAIPAGVLATPARLLRVPGRGMSSHRRFRGAIAAAALTALAGVLLLVPAAPAAAAGEDCLTDPPAFGLCELDVGFADSTGAPSMQAGSHPYAFTTRIAVNTFEDEEGQEAPVEAAKDVIDTFPPGLVGAPTATPRCTAAQFLTGNRGECPDASAVGIAEVELGAAPGEPHELRRAALYNLYPSPGEAAKFGFLVEGRAPVVFSARVNPDPPYNLIVPTTNISQAVYFYAATLRVWGVPGDERHDDERGKCVDRPAETGCFFGAAVKPFLTLPTRCAGPLAFDFEADSWQHPGAWVAEPPVLTRDETGEPLGPYGCSALGFSPTIDAQPTSRAASSPSGLDFSLDVDDPGLTNPKEGAVADSAIEKAEVTLPEGMTINPSQAEGLAVCSEADLARETASSPFGAGCPQASKIGSIEVETPLLEDTILHGSLFVAEPYRNLAGDSLIAVYVVIKDPGLGILIRQPLKVEPGDKGQLKTTAADMPQIPFSHFRLHFREGGRAPLISPPGCGSFQTEAVLYPYSGGPPVTSTSAFQIVSGPNNSGCPSGAAPFHPGFEAGTLSNQAGSYSPFYMRLTRGDGEADLSRFSAVLPPGVVGRIAGIPWCPESGIAQALSRTGEHGGEAELADPSCPAASQIGRTLAGAGVGSQLTYVPGSLYLAGPYHGDPLSVVSITPAVAGPFDAGTVVVREALTLNPLTAQVQVDGAASDPIPHILQGIPLSLRDLRVYTDRPGFTLNATSCAPSNTLATLWGAGTVLAPSGETPVGLAARYQAAGCQALGFRPKLAIKLKGGTKRGAHPALRAVLTPRPGDANFAGAVVRLPHSAFLDQAHIRTVCTRVQFAAGAGNGAACPPGAVYGHATAWSPLLAQPLSGPVFLRSSNHKLPDLIVALRGQFQINLGARIDSKKGGIRTSFAGVPDAPVSRFILDMRGGKKGLIVNSRYLCHKPKRNRARANLLAQSGKRRTLHPVVRAVKCKHKRKGKKGNKGGNKKKGKRKGGKGSKHGSKRH